MFKRFFRNNTGSALVELALTTPLLVLMLVAAAELGRIAYAAIEVQNAARAGASYGSQGTAWAFQSAPDTIKQAAQNDAPNITDLTFPTAPTTACVCETVTSSTDTPSYNPSSGTISCTDATIKGCNTVNSTETQQVVQYVIVNTQATVKPMFHYPGIPTSFTLNGYSQMRVIQN